MCCCVICNNINGICNVVGLYQEFSENKEEYDGINRSVSSLDTRQKIS